MSTTKLVSFLGFPWNPVPEHGILERMPGIYAGRFARRSLGCILALAAGLGALEIALHLRPRLLPRWYRERFPMHGVEFFEPGILDRTPIEGVPLPLVVGAYSGPPPADLKNLGIVPPGEECDRERFADVYVPADSLGFPNPADLDRADVLLIGDSFAVAAGALRPAGLQARLGEATGLTVCNLGVAAVGPVHEEWLLENVGFAKAPRAVIWFLFSGNDVSGTLAPLLYKRKGQETYGKAYADRRAPQLVLPDLARAFFSAKQEPEGREPLPGFVFRLADGEPQPIWFHPGEVLQLQWSREDWEKNPAWKAAGEILVRVRDGCERRGIRLLLVYLPTKAEVYLPYVEPDAALTLRTASSGLPEPLTEDPASFLRRVLEHRGDLEQVFHAFCEAEGVPFLSATPYLESLARAGELGFLVCDTHWQTVGQETLLEPLIALLRRQGILGP